MLTDSSLALITFINLFFIPFISLRIYCKRNNIEWKLNFELVYRYVFFSILNLPFARVFASIIEKQFGIICNADSTKYTLVAILTACILPILIEIIEHRIKLDVIITYKNKKEKK